MMRNDIRVVDEYLYHSNPGTSKSNKIVYIILFIAPLAVFLAAQQMIGFINRSEGATHTREIEVAPAKNTFFTMVQQNSYSYCSTPPPGCISGHVTSLAISSKSNKAEIVGRGGGGGSSNGDDKEKKKKVSLPRPSRFKRGFTSWRK
jgi:hypothetical protein